MLDGPYSKRRSPPNSRRSMARRSGIEWWPEARRYVRLRPRPSLAAILGTANEPALPAEIDNMITRTTIEILTLRRTMSYELPQPKE